MLEAEPRSLKSPYKWGLILTVGIAITSFLFATAYTQIRLSSLDTAAIAIDKITSPSLTYLTKTKEKLDELSDTLRRDDSDMEDSIRVQVDAIRSATHGYLRLNLLRGEQALWSRVNQSLVTLERSVETLQKSPTNNLETPIANLYASVQTAKDAIFDTIQYDLKMSSELAEDIVGIRKTTTAVTLLLDIFAVLLSIGVVIVVSRVFLRHDLLVEKQKELLRRQVAELDRFSGRVAHDLKNPLAAMESALGLFASETGKTTSSDMIQMAKRNARRASILVDDLLAFAKAGGKPAPNGATSIATVLNRVRDLYGPQAQESNVLLNLQCGPGIQVACSDGVLFSIITNLVGNAIKHMGDSNRRQIFMITEVEKDRVRISIVDTGPGIPLDFQSRVFEPFERLEAKSEGFGLGLATVKRLTESHGGQVGVDSIPGEGSSFWFTLPLVKIVKDTVPQRVPNKIQTAQLLPQES